MIFSVIKMSDDEAVDIAVFQWQMPRVYISGEIAETSKI